VALREFTDIENFFGFDISIEMLQSLKYRWGQRDNLHISVCDFSKDMSFPETDLTTAMGVFPYIFEQEDLEQLLNNVKSNTLIVRVPCSVEGGDVYINKYSDDLDSEYSSIYRTPDKYEDTFIKFFSTVMLERAYPDDIESKYGTKHYFFVCHGNGG
jgi:hypothetical protein